MNQKILFTGASGFIGRSIINILSDNFKITKVGLGQSNDIDVDLSKTVINFKEVYDVIIHAAGRAHIVPKTNDESINFYEINYLGTINLCKSLELSGVPKFFIFISTVAVYGNDYGNYIDENSPLLGNTPYAKSKIMAENYLQEWCKKNSVILTILRPALVAGKNPPGNLGSMIKSIEKNQYFRIGKGNAEKSILMVDDIANIIPLVMNQGGVYNLCSSEKVKLRDIENLICLQLNKNTPLSIPYWIIYPIALLGNLIGDKSPITTERLKKLTNNLTFSNSKAISELGWQPMSVLENFKIR